MKQGPSGDLILSQSLNEIKCLRMKFGRLCWKENFFAEVLLHLYFTDPPDLDLSHDNHLRMIHTCYYRIICMVIRLW